MNQGGGSFTDDPGRTAAVLGGVNTSILYSSAAMADLDGDGDVDIAMGTIRQSEATSKILWNDGSGRFTSKTDLPGGPFAFGNATDVEVVDINQDGLGDLVYVHHDGSFTDRPYVQILINRGGGSFVDETAARMPVNAVSGEWWRTHLTYADFDGDGDLDILSEGSTQFGANPIQILENNGSGVFTAVTLTGMNNYAVPSTIASDLNGDGAPDLVQVRSHDPGTGQELYFTTYANTSPGPFWSGTGTRDYIQASDGANHVRAWQGDDIVYGWGGSDTLSGDLGNDVLYGNLEVDILNGGAGNDTLFGGQNSGAPSPGVGDSADGILRQRDGVEHLIGGSGDDVLYGQYGSDVVNGGSGNDLLFGGQEADTVVGDAGTDTIHGNRGDDLLYGGSGADTFVFGSQWAGNDTVADFEAGLDRLDVHDPAAVTVGTAASGFVLLTHGGGTIELTGVSPGAFNAAWLV